MASKRKAPETFAGYADFLLDRPHLLDSRNKAYHLGAWKRAFSGYALSAIRPRDIEIVLCAWRQDFAGNTLNTRLEMLRWLFNEARKDGLRPDSPCDRIRKMHGNKRNRILAEDEEEILFRALPDWAANPARLALWTGLRMENAAHLRREWVHWDIGGNGTIIIPGQFTKGGRLTRARGGEPRPTEIPLYPQAAALIRAAAPNLTHPYIFSGSINKEVNMNTLKAAFHAAWIRTRETIALRRGVPLEQIEDFHFHDLRHTFATRYLLAAGDPYALIAAGLWGSLKELERYANFKRPHIQAAFAKAGAALATP